MESTYQHYYPTIETNYPAPGQFSSQNVHNGYGNFEIYQQTGYANQGHYQPAPSWHHTTDENAIQYHNNTSFTSSPILHHEQNHFNQSYSCLQPDVKAETNEVNTPHRINQFGGQVTLQNTNETTAFQNDGCPEWTNSISHSYNTDLVHSHLQNQSANVIGQEKTLHHDKLPNYSVPNENFDGRNERSLFTPKHVQKSSTTHEASPTKSLKEPQNKKGDDNAFSIQQWRQWKIKYSSKDADGFHCLVCPGKTYSTERAMLRHYKQVHESICAQCKICFSEESLLKQHKKENHEFWCFPCSKVYTTSRALRRHNQQKHGISQSRSVTQSQIDTNQSIKNELNNGNKEDVSQNQDCADFDYKTDLYYQNDAASNQDSITSTLEAYEEIQSADVYSNGNISHQEESVECRGNYLEGIHNPLSAPSTRDAVSNPCENINYHPPERGFEDSQRNNLSHTSCFEASEYCQNEITGYYNGDAEFKPYTTDIGNQLPYMEPKPVMKTDVGTTRKQRAANSGSYPCPECPKRFSNNSNLKRHFNSTHCFPCKECGQKYGNKDTMEIHFKQEHLINCHVCSKTFSNNSNLNRHIKQAHTPNHELNISCS